MWRSFFLSTFIALALLAGYSAQAQVCGDGTCNILQLETCQTCPQDCGSCPLPSVSVPPVVSSILATPTPTPTATPTPTHTPTPTITPTPTGAASPTATPASTSASVSPTSTPAAGSHATSAAGTSATAAKKTVPSPTSTPATANAAPSQRTAALVTPAPSSVPLSQGIISLGDFSSRWITWTVLLVASVLMAAAVAVYFFGQRRSDAVRQEYVPKVVHELRTPLAAMRGYLSMMLKGNFGPVSPAQKGPLIDVIASSQRLSSMVNDMLDESSLEAGKIKLRTSDFALDGVVQEVLVSLQPLAREKNLLLESESSGGAMVLADRDRVKQILINLIGNSLKFTDEGSIRVSSGGDTQFVKVFVSNTGPAMTPEQQRKLFQKFEQLGTKASGTGLGLHVARELARAMGGDLWLEKSIDGGDTTFGFSLPRATLASTQQGT